ncbi:hypothetical protein P692DRAFT_201873470 [Suillus brevipes Sb2]|nr:hypothetical protein P692DRAFT_201873470 [Suillus brevipes Sb2]
MNQFHLPQPGYFHHPAFHYPAPNVIPGATPGLATTFDPPPVPQAPGSSAGVKNASHKFWVDKNPSTSNKMMKGPLFMPVLDEHGQHNGKFVCSDVLEIAFGIKHHQS